MKKLNPRQKDWKDIKAKEIIKKNLSKKGQTIIEYILLFAFLLIIGIWLSKYSRKQMKEYFNKIASLRSFPLGTGP